MNGPALRISSRMSAQATSWARNVSAMLAGVLADATNLGPEANGERVQSELALTRSSWMRTFHARSETYRAAQACVADAHTRHPHCPTVG